MIIKNPVTDTITISEFSLNVHLESTKRKKTISLQVKDNKLTIKAPKAMSKKKLDELIQKKNLDKAKSNYIFRRTRYKK